MRTRSALVALVALVLVAPAGPARAQLSNRSISVESGISLPGEGAAGGAAPLALAATRWLDGDVHLAVRLAFTDAPGTAGRAAASVLAGTAGLVWTPGTAELRPRLLAEAGWARVERRGGGRDRAALGAGAGLEWFPARDLALQATVALRRTDGWRLEVLAGVAVLF